jgi:hypothetical protein
MKNARHDMKPVGKRRVTDAAGLELKIQGVQIKLGRAAMILLAGGVAGILWAVAKSIAP